MFKAFRIPSALLSPSSLVEFIIFFSKIRKPLFFPNEFTWTTIHSSLCRTDKPFYLSQTHHSFTKSENLNQNWLNIELKNPKISWNPKICLNRELENWLICFMKPVENLKRISQNLLICISDTLHVVFDVLPPPMFILDEIKFKFIWIIGPPQMFKRCLHCNS